MQSSTAGAKANHLIREKSPYLQQHAYNPVDWYPWGDEAFAKAKREDKPVFLSIGYSTCHWCHVMERESFESPEIAELLNRFFVSVKVDREEHPDVDHIYMSAVMAMMGQGGWPLTVFLTPERKPFYGATYIPPERRWNMAGMKDILPAIAQAWKEERASLLKSSEELTRALNDRLAQTGPHQAPDASVLDAAFAQAQAAFDDHNGGFGEAPKFPRSHELSFLLRYGYRTGKPEAIHMAAATLDAISRGGIHDHLGGGIHRYSTDAAWLVPHFEKMLYDQALTARAALESYQLTRRPQDAVFARDILDYVLRDLRHPEGAFYSAEDADSEGEEGKFYVWRPQEIEAVLGKDDAWLISRYYGVSAKGNFEHGSTILNVKEPLAEAAASLGIQESVAKERLESAKAKLLAARAQRARPHRDDKILTSWNGLMIAALAYGGSVLDEPRYTDAARAAARFLKANLYRDGVVLRRFRDGESALPGTLEDYAFFAYGLLELFESTQDPDDLQSALSVTEAMVDRFWDPDGGGFWMRDQKDEPLISGAKEVYDGATPSGNSIASLVLLRLGHLTLNSRWENLGRQTIEAFAGTVTHAPFGYPQFLIAVDGYLGPRQEIVLAGDPETEAFGRLHEVVRSRFLPRATRIVHPNAGTAREKIEKLIPALAPYAPVGGEPAAYVCERFACGLPITEPDALAELLDSKTGGAHE